MWFVQYEKKKSSIKALYMANWPVIPQWSQACVTVVSVPELQQCIPWPECHLTQWPWYGQTYASGHRDVLISHKYTLGTFRHLRAVPAWMVKQNTQQLRRNYCSNSNLCTFKLISYHICFFIFCKPFLYFSEGFLFYI